MLPIIIGVACLGAAAANRHFGGDSKASDKPGAKPPEPSAPEPPPQTPPDLSASLDDAVSRGDALDRENRALTVKVARLEGIVSASKSKEPPQ